MKHRNKKPHCKSTYSKEEKLHDANEREHDFWEHGQEVKMYELLKKLYKLLNTKLIKEVKEMGQTLADVQAAITAVDAKVDGVAGQVADLATDFDEAVKKLQEDIQAGADLTPAVEALGALSTKLDSAAEALSAIDVKAETISGKPTPPVEE